MYPEILQQFLDEELAVDWQTQEDIELCADAVEQIIGRKITRKYVRGYSKRDYSYFAWASIGDGMFCLHNHENAAVCSVETFLSELYGRAEECEINIGDLL